MVEIATLRRLALSFPEVTEQPHFEKASFRVGKKIFVTLDVVKHQCCVKLSLADQDLYSVYDNRVIFPVPNKWGKQGWTFINLGKVPQEMLKDALKAAFLEVAPKKLAAMVNDI